MGKVALDTSMQELLTLWQNYLNTQQSGLKSEIGTLAEMATTSKTSLVAAINELVGKDKTLDTRTNPFTLGTNHKFIYRGKYLGSVITDAQWQAISSGSFDDLYLGDYWVINGKTYIIIDFDYFDSKTHHVVVIVYLGTHKYNEDPQANNPNGYYGSDIRNNVILPFVAGDLTQAFGAAHLFKHTEFLCNAHDMNKGLATGYIQVDDCCAELPSWRMAIRHRTFRLDYPGIYPENYNNLGRDCTGFLVSKPVAITYFKQCFDWQLCRELTNHFWGIHIRKDALSTGFNTNSAVSTTLYCTIC